MITILLSRPAKTGDSITVILTIVPQTISMIDSFSCLPIHVEKMHKGSNLTHQEPNLPVLSMLFTVPITSLPIVAKPPGKMSTGIAVT